MSIVDRIIFDELVRRGLRPDGVASMAAAQRAKSDSSLPIAKDVKAWRLLQIDWRIPQMRPADRSNQKV
jgi:hypothetical protein